MRTPRLRLLLILSLLALLGVFLAVVLLPRTLTVPTAPAVPAAREAFEARRSGVWLGVEGEVYRILRDDLKGRRHQRFLIRLEDGLSLLISHNISLTPRVPVAVGDRVEAYGRYEWNKKGGLLHWTHRDPQGRRPGGWVKHRGKTYR
ncbi:MAG: DUF3465 domain-containing protein [Nitrospinota bacterium]